MSSVSSTTSAATTTTASTTTAATATTSGTKTTTSVDWSALIESQVASKMARATSIQTTITSNETKIAAYQSVQTLLSTLATSTSSLASSIVNALSSSAFGARSATISATGDVSASSALSMSIGTGAATGDHTLTISQVATAQKVVGTAVADQTAALGSSGTFSIGLAGGSSVEVAVTSDMSLQDVADAINAQTSTSNVQASVIQVSSSQFELVLSGTEDAADIETSSVSGDDVMNKLGITDSSGAFANVLQTARPANFTLDGVALTRNTNDISDVLSGVTFNLLQATPSGSTLNISIEPDTSAIQTAVESFVQDYNAFREYAATQQQLDTSGSVSSTSVLFGDGTLRSITTQMEAALNQTVGGLSLSDLGLSFSDTNDLELDTNVLSSVLTNNLDGVMSLLASRTTTSSSVLSVVNTSASPPASFVLDIAVDSSGALSASVGGDSSLFTVSGKSILGASGTIYAGMAFTYTGAKSASITVTSTTGIAAQINAVAKTNSNTSTGALQTLISNLQTQDDTMTQQIDDITARATLYRTMLTAQYAKYQSAISLANSRIDYLSALLNSGSNN